MIFTVSEINLSKLRKGRNYSDAFESVFRPGMFDVIVKERRQGNVMSKLGMLRPVKTQTFKEMTKERTGDGNFIVLKNHRGQRKYVLKVRPNASTYLVNVDTHKVQKVNIKNVFTDIQKRKIQLNNYIKNQLEQIRVKKVNHTNKSDPVALYNFKNGDYAYKVKTGTMTAYYRPSTIKKLMNMYDPNSSNKVENTVVGSRILFNNPLLGYNNSGRKFPVRRRDISKVRMVKPHKVRSTT